MIALEERTVDRVVPGEQQPETEHNFRGERTQSGVYEGRFYRHARGWFSYDFANPDMEGKVLGVTYSGSDKDRTFDILVNGEVLSTVSLTGKEATFYTIEYPIPDIMFNKKMTIRFQAKDNSVAGGVFDIRLLKAD